ncbi:hypothetical protein D3C83_19660 [compost metagenome]
MRFRRVETAAEREFDQRGEIALEPHHDRLRFGIAHAAVELEHPDGVVGDHQSGVEKTDVGCAIFFHAA